MPERDTGDPMTYPVSRRQLLLGAAAGVLGACGPSSPTIPRARLAEIIRRFAAATGTETGTEAEGTLNRIERSGPLEVAAGRTLRFDPEVDTTLEVTGNLVVRGRLEMHPRPGVEHVLRFVDVDESAFVGGGLDPLDTDVGLWVMGDGVLDVVGTPKTAWNRSGSSPSWSIDDELVVAPVEPGDFEPKPFTAGEAVPAFAGRRAEVLNLTRNARIEGTPGGRAHVFIRSTRPQTITNAALRHLGPRQADGEYTASVLGRYGLHFHHCHQGSTGSVVEGVVVRDCGAHAFVPHMSHGITMRDTIAYEVFDEAYWWDPHDRTDDLLIDRCVAAGVHFDPEFRGFRLAGFFLGLGSRVRLQRCVAFAIQGSRNAAGYVWPEAPSGLWRFRDNLAHNNLAAGIFVWQNVREPHHIDGFTAYNNGNAGIVHGAYSNSYHFRDLDLRDQELGIELIAAGRPDLQGSPQSWKDVEAQRLLVSAHGLPSDAPVLFLRCTISRGISIDDAEGDPGALDFIDCGVEPEDFTVVSMNPGTIVRVQRDDGSAYELTVSGVRDIAAFYPY